jgi:hypothetical protein
MNAGRLDLIVELDAPEMCGARMPMGRAFCESLRGDRGQVDASGRAPRLTRCAGLGLIGAREPGDVASGCPRCSAQLPVQFTS